MVSSDAAKTDNFPAIIPTVETSSLKVAPLASGKDEMVHSCCPSLDIPAAHAMHVLAPAPVPVSVNDPIGQIEHVAVFVAV